MEKKYRNLGYILLLLIPLTFLGFLKTYFNQFFDFNDKIDTWIHLHAIIASVWILMLIIQPLLIRNKKLKIHRLIGKISYFVFPLLILSFVPQMIKILHSDYIRPLFFPLADCIILMVFYGLAIYHRKSSPKHMRYMIAVALVFLGPTIGRIAGILINWPPLVGQNVLYGIIYLTLVGLIYFDKANSKNPNPYIFSFIIYIIHQAVFLVIFL